MTTPIVAFISPDPEHPERCGMSRRVTWSIVIAAVAPVFFWLGGFNFDHRGEAAVACAFLAIFLGVACYTYPGWEP